MTSVYDQYGLKCPKCGDDEGLYVSATVDVLLFEDGTEAMGGHEWTGESLCRCGNCGFADTVREFEDQAEEAP